MKKLLAAFGLGIVFSLVLNLGGSWSREVYKNQLVTVHAGDTLWGIASVWSGQEEDVRDVINRIVVENKLPSSTAIISGQKLIVPVRQDREQMQVAQAQPLQKN